MLGIFHDLEFMVGDFYYSVFKNGGMCDFDISYIDVFDAFKAVKTSGVYAVLAHPGQQKNYSLIHELVEVGLDGLELNHISKIGEIQELVIKNGMQGNGIGKKLLSQLENTAISEGCTQVELSSNQKRIHAHRFYEREGFIKTHFKLSKL